MSLQTLNGKQIRNNVLEDRHIKTKLSEAVLDIKWKDAGHAADILKNKTIIDYVQYNTLIDITNGVSEIEVNLGLDTSEVSIPGIILDVPIRFRDENGDPVRCENGKEVIAKIASKTRPNVDDGGFDYTISFTTQEGEPFLFPTSTKIDFLYPIKTTLWDASESFASNERFIDGAVDIRTRLDIIQLAKDIYGEGYVFNANGNITVDETLEAMLQRLAHGSTHDTTSISATNIIDEVYTARDGYDSLDERLDAEKAHAERELEAFKSKLTSEADSNGTSLVGHYDPNELFLSNRLNEILEEIGGLIKDAEGSKLSITERLAESLRDSGVLKDNEKIHTHGKHAMKITSETSTIVFDEHALTPLETLQLTYGIDDLEIYYNGNLQAETMHYTITKTPEGLITGIDLTPDTMIDGDVVILKWTIYNKFKA